MIERLVAFSVHRRWLVLVLALILTVAGAGTAAHLFRINTDVERLIAPDVPWRHDEIQFEKAFPQRSNLLVAVIDAQTPEQADEAASRLTDALARHKDLLPLVYRPDGGAFFDKNGLLLMGQKDLEQTTEQLIQQQGLLGPLAADPSLRGIMQALGLGAQGIKAVRRRSRISPARSGRSGTCSTRC